MCSEKGIFVNFLKPKMLFESMVFIEKKMENMIVKIIDFYK